MQALCSSVGPLGAPCHGARLHEEAPSFKLRRARQQLGCVSCLAGRSPPALPKRWRGNSSSFSAPISRSFQAILSGAPSVTHTFSARTRAPPVGSTGSNAREEGHLRRRHTSIYLRTDSVAQIRALHGPAPAGRKLNSSKSHGAFFKDGRPVALGKPARILGSPVAFSRGSGDVSSNDPLGVFSFLDHAFSSGMFHAPKHQLESRASNGPCLYEEAGKQGHV